MNNKIIAIVVIAVVVVGGAAYGLTRNKKTDTNSTSSSSNTSQTSSTNPASSSTNSAGKESTNGSGSSSSSSQSTNAVSISNFAFSPNAITVKKGTTVTWTNNDSVAHTVQETDGKSGPKSNDLAHGETYTYTFIAAGTYAYHCSIHPDMTGTVTVTE